MSASATPSRAGHAALLRHFEPDECSLERGDNGPCSTCRMKAAIFAVLQLHRPLPESDMCDACSMAERWDEQLFPCPTFNVVAEQLKGFVK